MTEGLPPLLSCYLGLLGIAEQLLYEDLPDTAVIPMAEGHDGRQLLIARRYGRHLLPTAANLLASHAAALIATGRTDVHRSLQITLEAVATRLQACDDPELVRLGASIAEAVRSVLQATLPAPERRT